MKEERYLYGRKMTANCRLGHDGHRINNITSRMLANAFSGSVRRNVSGRAKGSFSGLAELFAKQQFFNGKISRLANVQN